MKRGIKRLFTAAGFSLGIHHLADDIVDLKQSASTHWRYVLLDMMRYRTGKRLNRHEYQVFSQNGEDGFIAEVLRRIGVTNRYFVEFGVGEGLENNTAYLLMNGWKGLWIEIDQPSCRVIETGLQRMIRPGRLTVKNCRVSAENIEQIFSEAAVPGQFDLLSIDIDGNDYWVWEAIRHFSPRVVIIEYNSGLGPHLDWKVAYEPGLKWNGSAYFGASLKALESLGARKGYALVGCTLSGTNAVFVKKDLAREKFLKPFTAENHYECYKDGLFDNRRYKRCFDLFQNDRE
jgi:hypothetical protein